MEWNQYPFVITSTQVCPIEEMLLPSSTPSLVYSITLETIEQHTLQLPIRGVAQRYGFEVHPFVFAQDPTKSGEGYFFDVVT